MKVSTMIKSLQAFLKEHGDMDCWYAIDDEGNDYRPVYYYPSCYYMSTSGYVYQDEDLDGEDPEEHLELTPICIVN